MLSIMSKDMDLNNTLYQNYKYNRTTTTGRQDHDNDDHLGSVGNSVSTL